METTAAVPAGLSIFDLIRQAWYTTYPLIAMSFIATSIIIERLWVLRTVRRAIESVTDTTCELLREGDWTGAGSMLSSHIVTSPAARIYAALLPLLARQGVEEVVECGERRRLDETRLFKSGTWLLGTAAASAPFIGLLGTVIGIIKSFHQMATMGAGGFAVVAAGISEALVATAMGLFVAILALISYNYFQVKISALDTQLRVGLGRVIEAAAIGGIHEGGTHGVR